MADLNIALIQGKLIQKAIKKHVDEMYQEARSLMSGPVLKIQSGESVRQLKRWTRLNKRTQQVLGRLRAPGVAMNVWTFGRKAFARKDGKPFRLMIGGRWVTTKTIKAGRPRNVMGKVWTRQRQKKLQQDAADAAAAASAMVLDGVDGKKRGRYF